LELVDYHVLVQANKPEIRLENINLGFPGQNANAPRLIVREQQLPAFAFTVV
jgi:hypothetical protein